MKKRLATLFLGMALFLYGCASNEDIKVSEEYERIESVVNFDDESSIQGEMVKSEQLQEATGVSKEVSEDYEKIQNRYVVNQLRTIENGALIDEAERFWISASDTDGKSYFLCADISGRIWGKHEMDDHALPRIMLSDDLTAFELYQEGRFIILDLDGNDKTYDFIGEDEYISCMVEDSTGITIVSVKEQNTYSTQNIVYTFYDENKNVKFSCERMNLEDEYGVLWTNLDEKIDYVGGSMYCIQDIDMGFDLFMDVYAKKAWIVDVGITGSGQIIWADASNTLIYMPGGVEVYVMDNSSGELSVISTRVEGNGYAPGNGIYEGMFCARCDWGGYKYLVFNTNGEVVIDLNYSDTRTADYVEFIDSRALLQLRNDANVPYVTIMDKNGTWLFEPIQGMPIRTNLLNYGYCDGTGFYLLQSGEKEDKSYLLDKDGNLKEIELPFTNKYDNENYQLDASGIVFSYIDNQLYCIYFKEDTINKLPIQ